MKYNYELARKLRKNQTPQERKMWNLLRNRQFHNLEFRRQFPMENYVADFLCKKEKIIIEIDGSQHNLEENILKDELRTKFFETKGYRIIRFWNNDIDNNIEGVFLELEKFIFNN